MSIECHREQKQEISCGLFRLGNANYVAHYRHRTLEQSDNTGWMEEPLQ